MVVRGPRGERVVKAEDFFIGPGVDITRMTCWPPPSSSRDPNPGDVAGAHFYFEKVRDRKVWDFPLLNVASATSNRAAPSNASAWSSTRSRLAAAPETGRSGRRRQAPQRGNGRDGRRYRDPGRCSPKHNGYKMPFMRNLVKRAIRGNGDT